MEFTILCYGLHVQILCVITPCWSEKVMNIVLIHNFCEWNFMGVSDDFVLCSILLTLCFRI